MGNGKVVLYITFIDFTSSPTSGSSVRPMRMLDAFKERGYEVKLLSGAGNNRQVRNENVKEIKDWLKSNRPNFCYIEPPSGPLFFNADRSLIRTLHQMRIPIGFFYRDLYWKFPSKEFNSRSEFGIKWFKNKLIHWMQFRDFRLIQRNIDQIYFPSNACNQFMKLDEYSVLPPGCKICDLPQKEKFDATAIYVGGATVRYGLGLVLESCFKVADKMSINLHVVCPEQQWKEWIIEYPQYQILPEWISLHHIGDGPRMEELYIQSDFALVPILKTGYNNLALPIKLFEYISRLLPVVVTRCDAMEDFLRPYEIGYLSDDNVYDYSQAIGQMILNQKKYNDFKSNLVQARKENLWVMRVDQIEKDLGEK